MNKRETTDETRGFLGGSAAGQIAPEGHRKPDPDKTINCDQVAWLLDIAGRYIEKDQHPSVSRQNEMKKYGMLYEIMEIMGCGFLDDSARHNGTPPAARLEKILTLE